MAEQLIRTLTASADGVGTKTILATDHDMYPGLGIDLVAMCVNDLVCKGSKPLFFMDYLGFNNVESQVFRTLIDSIQKGCKEAGCTLIGGETAEMPGLYKRSWRSNKNYFDMAGFAVGEVEEGSMLPKEDIKSGDLILGLPSSGVHSNGFSLIRMIIKDSKIDPQTTLINEVGRATSGAIGEAEGKSLIETLMTPTVIYVKTILDIANLIQGCAHITGGGMNNIQRILPDKVTFELDHWDFPPIFQWIQQEGGVTRGEMLRVFNCGYGMVLVVKEEKNRLSELKDRLEKLSTHADIIGRIVDKKP